MNEIKKDEIKKDEVKKDNNPLSVRVDPYYKDVFEDLIKKKKIPKKSLLEAMIASYVDIGVEDEREANISFANEINLIAGNFNEIMSTFKMMAEKSQDTLGTQKSYYEQKIVNLETTKQMLENKNDALLESNKVHELTSTNNKLDKEKLEKSIKELTALDKSSEKEISVFIRKNAELLEQITMLQKKETLQIIQKTEIEMAKKEINALKTSLEDKTYENKKWLTKVADLEENIAEMRKKKESDFKNFEVLLRKEAEVDKKLEILKLQLQYNELQADSMKNLAIINQKTQENADLKRQLEKLNK